TTPFPRLGLNATPTPHRPHGRWLLYYPPYSVHLVLGAFLIASGNLGRSDAPRDSGMYPVKYTVTVIGLRGDRLDAPTVSFTGIERCRILFTVTMI
ncbi:hypothetical protein, partial [Thiohalocapsa marina]|uniref:hypothetical protein n=1 Tax=Thiohalocapsa marina TaxID=424902 RepID=UPI001B886A59